MPNCQICNEHFATLLLLEEHVYQSHGDNPLQNMDVSSNNSSSDDSSSESESSDDSSTTKDSRGKKKKIDKPQNIKPGHKGSNPPDKDHKYPSKYTRNKYVAKK